MLQYIEQLAGKKGIQFGEQSKLKSPDAFARKEKEVKFNSPFLEYTEFVDDGDFELSFHQERRSDLLERMPAPSTEKVGFNVTDWPQDAFPSEYKLGEMGMPFEMISRQSSVSSENSRTWDTSERHAGILQNDTHAKLFLEENQLTALEEFEGSESQNIGGVEFSEESFECYGDWENYVLDWEDSASEISADIIECYGDEDILSSPSSKLFQEVLESHGDDPRIDLEAEISHDEEEEESEESERLAWLDAVQFREFFNFPLNYLQPCHENELYE